MTIMNNSLIDLLHCQEKIQNDTMCAFWVIHQCQGGHADDSFTDDFTLILTFDSKPELNFDRILKLGNYRSSNYRKSPPQNWL